MSLSVIKRLRLQSHTCHSAASSCKHPFEPQLFLNCSLNALCVDPGAVNRPSRGDCDSRMLWLIAERLFLSLSPVLVVGDGGERRVEAVDVERHVALVAQQLHVGILLPAAHAAGTEAALGLRVSFAVLTLRAGLPWSKSGSFTDKRFYILDRFLHVRLNCPSAADRAREPGFSTW